jgi:hypothetical protein
MDKLERLTAEALAEGSKDGQSIGYNSLGPAYARLLDYRIALERQPATLDYCEVVKVAAAAGWARQATWFWLIVLGGLAWWIYG